MDGGGAAGWEEINWDFFCARTEGATGGRMMGEELDRRMTTGHDLYFCLLNCHVFQSYDRLFHPHQFAKQIILSQRKKKPARSLGIIAPWCPWTLSATHKEAAADDNQLLAPAIFRFMLKRIARP